MNTLFFLLEKEFKQIFRNRAIMALIMVMPVVQLLIIPLAADYEIHNINLAVLDQDHSSLSRQLTEKITSSGYFKLQYFGASHEDALRLVEKDKVDLILELPAGFERNLIREQQQKVFVAVNAINGTKGGLGANYLGAILGDFNRGILMTHLSQGGESATADVIEVTSTNRFNPLMNYKAFIVPGILAILVTLVGGSLSALNIVKEKEVGTIEQINVTPIPKYIFISGKLIPFWVLGNVGFSIGLLIARYVYGIVPQGNILLLYAFIWLYLLAVLGLGLLISTFCETQQQAMFIMFFFLIIFILLGGLFTPIDSMPPWAIEITRFNLIAYLIEVMRMIILKGSHWNDIAPHAVKVAIFALALNSWAIWNYRKKA